MSARKGGVRRVGAQLIPCASSESNASTAKAAAARSIHYSATDGTEAQVLTLLLSSSAGGNLDDLRRNLKFVGSRYVNNTDEQGWTALMYAARNGHAAAVKMLLEHGADMALRNPRGMTSFDVALFWHHVDVLRVMHAHRVTTTTTGDSASASVIARATAGTPLDRCGPARVATSMLRAAVRDESSRFVVFNRDLDALVSFDSKDRPRVLLATPNEIAPYLPAKLWKEDAPLQPVDVERTVLFLGRMAGCTPSRCLTDVVHHDGADDEKGFALFAVALDVASSDALLAAIAAELRPRRSADDVVAKNDDVVAAYTPSFPGLMAMRGTELRVAAYSRSLLAWHDRHGFCPTCGARTRVVDGGHKRLCTVDACRSRDGVHNTCHPRIDPVVIVLVESPDGNSCLLGRSARFPSRMFSCVSGFVEVGETLEEAACREVAEETGVEVRAIRDVAPLCTGPLASDAGRAEFLMASAKLAATGRAQPPGQGSGNQERDVTLEERSRLVRSVLERGSSGEPLLYRASQPWAFPGSLMIGFLATAASEDIELRDGELAEARWFSRQDMEAVFREKSWRLSSRGGRRGGGRGKGGGGSDDGPISIPPPMAVAHQLIKFWLEGKDEQQRLFALSRL